MIRKEIRFREKDESDYGYEYLKPYIERFPEKPLHEILELIFKEHETLKHTLEEKMMFVDMVAGKINEKLRTLEVRTGYIDKNMRINLELWNGYLYTNSQSNYPTTDEFLTIPLKNATQKISNDIHNVRQRNLERKAKQQEDEFSTNKETSSVENISEPQNE